MAFNYIKNSSFYDGKKLWDEYMSMGKAASYNMLAKKCVEWGMVNKQNGKATHMGVKFAMWRYAARNPETAYETFKGFKIQFGEYMNFDEFCWMIYEHCASPNVGLVIGLKEKKRFYEKYLKGKESEDNKEHSGVETVAQGT